MDNIKRGEMFYISRGGASYSGSEQHSDRPAVVVSNNKNNENSNVVEIVYMTTQPKTDLPTHVTVRSTGRPSTVLCEQVYSVSTERIGTYIGECTDKEMENIDIALMISLQLDGSMKTSKKYNETIKNQQEEIELYRSKIQAMEQELEEKAKAKPENTEIRACCRKYGLLCLCLMRIVRIKIVLTVKFTILINLTISCQACTKGKLYNLFIQYGKGAWHTGTHRTGMGVRCSSKGSGTATEDFRSGGKLYMNLKSDNCLILFHALLPPSSGIPNSPLAFS